MDSFNSLVESVTPRTLLHRYQDVEPAQEMPAPLHSQTTKGEPIAINHNGTGDDLWKPTLQHSRLLERNTDSHIASEVWNSDQTYANLTTRDNDDSTIDENIMVIRRKKQTHHTDLPTGLASVTSQLVSKPHKHQSNKRKLIQDIPESGSRTMLEDGTHTDLNTRSASYSLDLSDGKQFPIEDCTLSNESDESEKSFEMAKLDVPKKYARTHTAPGKQKELNHTSILENLGANDTEGDTCTMDVGSSEGTTEEIQSIGRSYNANTKKERSRSHKSTRSPKYLIQVSPSAKTTGNKKGSREDDSRAISPVVKGAASAEEGYSPTISPQIIRASQRCSFGHDELSFKLKALPKIKLVASSPKFSSSSPSPPSITSSQRSESLSLSSTNASRAQAIKGSSESESVVDSLKSNTSPRFKMVSGANILHEVKAYLKAKSSSPQVSSQLSFKTASPSDRTLSPSTGTSQSLKISSSPSTISVSTSLAPQVGSEVEKGHSDTQIHTPVNFNNLKDVVETSFSSYDSPVNVSQEISRFLSLLDDEKEDINIKNLESPASSRKRKLSESPPDQAEIHLEEIFLQQSTSSFQYNVLEESPKKSQLTRKIDKNMTFPVRKYQSNYSCGRKGSLPEILSSSTSASGLTPIKNLIHRVSGLIKEKEQDVAHSVPERLNFTATADAHVESEEDVDVEILTEEETDRLEDESEKMTLLGYLNMRNEQSEEGNEHNLKMLKEREKERLKKDKEITQWKGLNIRSVQLDLETEDSEVMNEEEKEKSPNAEEIWDDCEKINEEEKEKSPNTEEIWDEEQVEEAGIERVGIDINDTNTEEILDEEQVEETGIERVGIDRNDTNTEEILDEEQVEEIGIERVEIDRNDTEEVDELARFCMLMEMSMPSYLRKLKALNKKRVICQSDAKQSQSKIESKEADINRVSEAVLESRKSEAGETGSRNEAEVGLDRKSEAGETGSRNEAEVELDRKSEAGETGSRNEAAGLDKKTEVGETRMDRKRSEFDRDDSGCEDDLNLMWPSVLKSSMFNSSLQRVMNERVELGQSNVEQSGSKVDSTEADKNSASEAEVGGGADSKRSEIQTRLASKSEAEEGTEERNEIDRDNSGRKEVDLMSGSEDELDLIWSESEDELDLMWPSRLKSSKFNRSLQRTRGVINERVEVGKSDIEQSRSQNESTGVDSIRVSKGGLEVETELDNKRNEAGENIGMDKERSEMDRDDTESEDEQDLLPFVFKRSVSKKSETEAGTDIMRSEVKARIYNKNSEARTSSKRSEPEAGTSSKRSEPLVEEAGTSNKRSKADSRLRQLTMRDFLHNLMTKPKETHVADPKAKALVVDMVRKMEEVGSSHKSKANNPKGKKQKKIKKVESVGCLSRSITKEAFCHFSHYRVTSKAIDEVMRCSEQFWGNFYRDLKSIGSQREFAAEDIAKLFKRQGLANTQEELSALVQKYLPVEQWQYFMGSTYANGNVFPKKVFNLLPNK